MTETLDGVENTIGGFCSLEGFPAKIVPLVKNAPLVIIKFKNPTNRKAKFRSAWQQLQTCSEELPLLFPMNGLLVVSDGADAPAGSFNSGR